MTARMRLTSLALAIVVSIIGVGTTANQAPADPPSSWGDQNDGTYRNPILPADFSDPDAIRVGNDSYMVASDFHFTGMQVFRDRPPGSSTALMGRPTPIPVRRSS